jgi:predicted nucleotidyltransferase
MDFARPLDRFLGSSAQLAVLRAICALPSGYAATGREIARRAGISHPQEIRVLSDLTEEGFVQRQRVGRADTYRLNTLHVLADLICDLFVREKSIRQDLISFVRTQVATHAGSARAAYLFGSTAEGPTRPDSDIDVALVWPGARPDESEKARAAISEALRRRYGNEGQVLVRTSPLSERTARGAWKRVLDRGVLLKGPARSARG